MKWSIVTLISFVFSCSVIAQQLPDPSTFDNRTHDFGEIKEVEGPVMHEFLFTNELDNPVKIVNVRASCGCTTPGWSKGEILPGESGYVQAQYNPRNRPGAFRKSLKVTTSAPDNNVTVFYITGTVIPRPRTPADDYPVLIGHIRFKNRTLNLGRVTTQGPVTREFEVYNEGDKTISFQLDKIKAPAHIQFQFESPAIKPNEKGNISVTYDPIQKNDLGYVSDLVVLTTDEDSAAIKPLNVVATINEYFAPMGQEDLAKAPRLIFDKSKHDFGKVAAGASVSTEFVLTNQGANNLNIRKAKSNCGCVMYTLGKYDLQPAESTTMVVNFYTKGRRGNQQKAITIFSNDPRSSAQVITIKAVVSQPSNP